MSLKVKLSEFDVLLELISVAVLILMIDWQTWQVEQNLPTGKFEKHSQVKSQVQEPHSIKMADTYPIGAEKSARQVLLVFNPVWFNVSVLPDFDDDKLAESWTPCRRQQDSFLRAHSKDM